MSEDIVAANYVRSTIDRVVEVARESNPGTADHASWSLSFHGAILCKLDVAGYGEAILQAADDLARDYGLPPESREVGAPTLAEAEAVAELVSR